jgi:hypothetical protein
MNDLRVSAAVSPLSRMAGDRLCGVDALENPEK